MLEEFLAKAERSMDGYEKYSECVDALRSWTDSFDPSPSCPVDDEDLTKADYTPFRKLRVVRTHTFPICSYPAWKRQWSQHRGE